MSSDYDSFKLIVKNLHATWTYWNKMFNLGNASGDDLRTMHQVAPNFFMYIRWHMLSAIILELAKLADPLEMMKRQNLTLERVEAGFDYKGRENARKWAQKHLADALKTLRSEPIKLVRNRVLAHNDHLSLTGHDDPLPSLDIELIQNAIYHVERYAAALDIVVTDGDLNFSTGEGLNLPEQQWLDEVDALMVVLRKA